MTTLCGHIVVHIFPLPWLAPTSPPPGGMLPFGSVSRQVPSFARAATANIGTDLCFTTVARESRASDPSKQPAKSRASAARRMTRGVINAPTPAVRSTFRRTPTPTPGRPRDLVEGSSRRGELDDSDRGLPGRHAQARLPGPRGSRPGDHEHRHHRDSLSGRLTPGPGPYVTWTACGKASASADSRSPSLRSASAALRPTGP